MTAATLSAQTAPATAPASNEETIQLSPFEVSTQKDTGYVAANSLTGTRTNTPIKDIPMNIQVFTKELAEDLLIRNQVDFEAYNASLVNGGADRFSDNAIQQTYQAFLFRGFRQNWGLRDGIREYDPVDTQNLARVEVVKGPAAALYGLAYPGGVMNNITKTVDFTHNFANLRLTAGDQSDYRASVDANFTGALNGNKVGVRFNGVNERTQDVRAHSKGKVQLSSIELEWRPMEGTQAEFMMEHGYRGKPNGLQYFSTGTPASENGSHADVPLQIVRPDIPWTWNWANGKNLRSLETHLYRGSITQKIGDSFNVHAYMQYSSRLNIDGNGWDANGSGGADSWESSGSGMDLAKNTITSTYHYRDWGNEMHAYGATGVYKLDNVVGTNHTFAFGANVWAEKELSRASRPLNPLASAIVYPIQNGVPIGVPNFPPSDLVPETDGGPNGNGYHHENNSNDYYFANWQMYAFNNRLKTNVGVNKTQMKLVTWNSGASTLPENTYTASKVSPLFGAVYDITKEISVFGLHSTSLFPDSTKDSFGNQFGPQVGKSWEGGVKVELMEGKVSGTVSYFDIEQTGGTQSSPNHENLNTQRWDRLTDAQRAVEFPGRTRADLFAAGDIIAGGKQESKGFDVDIAYQPLRELQFVFSYEHVNHKFVTSADPTTIGQTYPGAQKNRYSLLSKYSIRSGALKNLSVGLGISGGDKALVDYQTVNGKSIARYEPSRVVAEAFASYRVKLGNQNTVWQLNVRNLTRTSDYVGWKATGSSTVLATERYKVPTPVVVRFTFGLDF